MHTKRTGHTEFVDKTNEITKPINLESPNPNGSSSATPMDVDASASAASTDPEGTFFRIQWPNLSYNFEW